VRDGGGGAARLPHLALPREDALRSDHARGNREQGNGVAPRHRCPPALHGRLRAGGLPRRHRGRANCADPRPVARHGRRHAGHRVRRGRARRPGEPARRDRRGPPDRRGAGDRCGLLDRGVHGRDLRRHGRRSPRATPGLVRHKMKKENILLLAAVLALPLVLRLAIASEILIFAIFGLGLNLLLGYTGLLSFGQSTFFGSAAYVAGYLLKHYAIGVFAALGIGVAVGAVSALLVGYLCVQRSGLYFIMLTFALNQLFYFIAYQWTSVTGGEDGMPGVPRPAMLGLALRADHRFVRLHLALGIDERGLGALAAAARRGVRHRGALLQGRRGRSLVSNMALLETHDLSKSFGALTAVNAVNLRVEAGTLHSIIGPNGAGKTTLFNLLTGTFPPSAGRIVFDGSDITGTRAHRIAHLGLARSFQRTNVFPAFSLLDNVWLAAFACSKSWRGLLWRRADRYPE